MRPAAPLILLLWLWMVIGIAAAFLPLLVAFWAGYGLLLAGVSLWDLWALRRQASPRCERRVPPALALGEWHQVTLRLHHELEHSRIAVVFDGHPVSCDMTGQPQSLHLSDRRSVDLSYRVRPRCRGELVFEPTEVLLEGPLRLFRRPFVAGERTPVRVYPNFREVAKLAMLTTDNRTARMGIHLQRRRGEGMEFFQLREYRQGDALRQVDWKAVSRRHQLISREYREEQNQQVLFLLDCGRRMHSQDGDLSHLDHVLNAVLLVTSVALRQGDGVGVLTFGSNADRWLAPTKGQGALNAMLNTVYELQTSTAPSDYAQAASRLSAHQKRRALVLLLTNLRDEDSSDLPLALASLRHRHLIVVASLREPLLHQVLAQPVHTFDDALRFGSTHHYLRARRRAHELVRGAGVGLLDVEPAQLPVALVNRYLEIKRSGSL